MLVPVGIRALQSMESYSRVTQLLPPLWSVTREVITVSLYRSVCCFALHLAAVVLSCLCTPLVKRDTRDWFC